MTKISLIANAKINLYLDITSKRPDGYHTLETVMQSVDPGDIVDIATAKRGGIRVSCSDPSIPENEGNICYKAARAFFEETGDPGRGADIRIEKRIPHGAGMGGGSADAAAVLVGLNRIYGGVISGERLSEIGAKIGADVPFCMVGGTKLCRGIGDEISDMEAGAFSGYVYLVVMPGFKCDTRGAYRRFDDDPLPRKGGLEEFLGSGARFPENMYNVFQRLYGDERINAVAERLSELGASGACLTGSGAAVFGVFSDAEQAANAAKAFPECFTSVCKPASRGIIIMDNG